VSDPIRWYTDEHIARAVSDGLRRRGCDVETTFEAGLVGASDSQQLAHATSKGRVVVTQDADFLRLHGTGIPHTGIVYAPQGTTIGDSIRGLMEMYSILEASDMHNHVEFL
jgi:hypothetical protein